MVIIFVSLFIFIYYLYPLTRWNYFFIISLFICPVVYLIINYNTFPCKQLNKHAINNTKKNVEELAAWDAHPSSEPCRRLLDLSERSSWSKHRLVWRSLRIRTKMSVKRRLPRSRHAHFWFGSKSFITGWILNQTSHFFRASLVGIYLF